MGDLRKAQRAVQCNFDIAYVQEIKIAIFRKAKLQL